MSTVSSDTPTTTAVLRAGGVALVAAAVGGVAVHLLALALGADVAIPAQPGAEELTPLPVSQTAVVIVVLTAAATAFAWLLARFVPARAALIFTVVAAAILAVSFVPVLTLGLATADIVTLLVLHLVVGIAIAVPLRSALQRA